MSVRSRHRAAWVVAAVLVALVAVFVVHLGEDVELLILLAITVALFAFGFCVSTWWTLTPLALLCAYFVVRSAIAPDASDCDDLCEGSGYFVLALGVAVLGAALAGGVLVRRTVDRRREDRRLAARR